MGQLKAGDTVRFVRVNNEPAVLRGEAPGVVIRNPGCVAKTWPSCIGRFAPPSSTGVFS